jgi:alkanesulfonate monooxygenase SsuD/methylene tetrahydromethanopterin reductase-like flavin-dependent oxidoreductase (luciferase family)
VNGLLGTPRPVQQPGPPLHIGGGGRKLLTLAGQVADIVGIHMRARPGEPIDWNERGNAGTYQKVAWVREAAGARFDEIELSALVYSVIITDDRRAAAAAYAEERGWENAPPEMVLQMPQLLIGTLDQIVDLLEWRRQEFGISYHTISDDHIEDFAPVVARLAGR